MTTLCLPKSRRMFAGNTTQIPRRRPPVAGRHQASALRIAAAVFLISLGLAVGPVNGQSANPVRKVSINAFDDIIRKSRNCLVVVMAAWCHPCIEELPHLNALDRKYRRRGLKTVGISLDYGGAQAIQPIVDNLKVRFPVYWCGEAAIAKYAITKIPLLLFVRNGRILRRVEGGRDRAAIEKEIIAFLQNP